MINNHFKLHASVFLSFVHVCPVFVSIAEARIPSYRNTSVHPVLAIAKKDADREERRSKIPFERYAFLKRLEIKFNSPLLYNTSSNQSSILFPVGRSDRTYLSNFGYEYDARLRNTVYCFQWKNNKIKLVYKVSLIENQMYRSETSGPKRSLTEYIHSSWLAVNGRINSYAQADLDTERDYVRYTWSANSEALVVSHLSHEVDHSYGSDAEFYNYNNDIFNDKGRFEWSRYYKLYGLPFARGE